MTFLITWRFHQGKLHDTLSLFSQMTQEQDDALMGDHVRLIGRWHDLIGGKGVAIFEADSADAIAAYALHWNQHMDLDIAVVTNDEQTRAIGTQLRE